MSIAELWSSYGLSKFILHSIHIAASAPHQHTVGTASKTLIVPEFCQKKHISMHNSGQVVGIVFIYDSLSMGLPSGRVFGCTIAVQHSRRKCFRDAKVSNASSNNHPMVKWGLSLA